MFQKIKNIFINNIYIIIIFILMIYLYKIAYENGYNKCINDIKKGLYEQQIKPTKKNQLWYLV